MAMAVGMAVPMSHHMFHDLVCSFDVMVSLLEARVHCTVMVVVPGVHHGWMVVAGKKSEHARFTPYTGIWD
jgi:hypothetical protein